MPYKRVRDILEQVRTFHERVREWCARRGEDENDPRAAWILAYVDGYEQEFQRMLSQFEADGRDNLLETWIQNVPDRELREELGATTVDVDMSTEEVMRRVQEFDNSLVVYYQSLAATLIPPRVADAFRALAEAQQTKSREYSRRLLEWSDQGRAGDGDKG